MDARMCWNGCGWDLKWWVHSMWLDWSAVYFGNEGVSSWCAGELLSLGIAYPLFPGCRSQPWPPTRLFRDVSQSNFIIILTRNHRARAYHPCARLHKIIQLNTLLHMSGLFVSRSGPGWDLKKVSASVAGVFVVKNILGTRVNGRSLGEPLTLVA